MSLKNDIEMVREELSSEEKFFEKAVITERFIKKYKNVMMGGVIAIVVVVASNLLYETNKHSKVVSANEALQKLQIDATNTQALSELKEHSSVLYDVWCFSQAVATKDVVKFKELENSKALLVADLATYELANDAKSLDEYAHKQNALYRDLASVQSAILLIKESKIEEAHIKLASISENSSLYAVGRALLHYGVK